MIETLSHPASSEEFLSRLHDGELPAAEAAAFEAHRSECPECRAAVAHFESALSAYRAAPVPPAASDLSARILRKLRAQTPSRRPFGVMFGIDLRWAGAVIAVLVLVIIASPVFWGRRREASIRVASAERQAAREPIPAYVLDEPSRQDVPAAPAAPVPRSRVLAKAAPEPPNGSPPAAPKDSASEIGVLASRANEDARTEPKEESASAAPPAAPAAAPLVDAADVSLSARRKSATAPVGGDSGQAAGFVAEEITIRLDIRSADGQGDPPDVSRAPEDRRFLPLRGREFVVVVGSGGRVLSVLPSRPADKLAAPASPGVTPPPDPAQEILRDLVFQPGDRSRRLVVAVR